jgi:hypothetical protein
MHDGLIAGVAFFVGWWASIAWLYVGGYRIVSKS